MYDQAHVVSDLDSVVVGDLVDEIGQVSDFESPSGDDQLYGNNHVTSHMEDDLFGYGGVSDSWALSAERAGPYSPIDYLNPPIMFPTPTHIRHQVGGLDCQMNLGSWCYELSFESDSALRSYLYNGILSGFQIVDKDVSIEPYFCRNYRSVLVEPCHSFLHSLIVSELAQDRFVLADEQPVCVHALGAVAKSSGGFRPVTDCRRPLGMSINNFMDQTHQYFSYNSVDLVASLMSQDCFMATLDISSAYRSVHIHPAHWKYHGIAWDIEGSFRFLYDVRLSFGLKCAPFVFTQISNFVVRCLHRRGITRLVNYLDDYILFGDSFESCQFAQSVLVSVLVSLGFFISWGKCTSPSKFTRFLGVDFDSSSMVLRLPEEKLRALHSELWFFKGRARATRHQIQRLCGLVAHAAKLVRGGRTFSRRLIDRLKGLTDNRRIRLGVEFQNDINWWLEFSTIFNGISQIVHADTDQIWFYTDASLTGYGWWCGSYWQAGLFDSMESPFPVQNINLDSSHGHWVNFSLNQFQQHDININLLELIPIYLALVRLSLNCVNRHFICVTDNTQVRTMVNKGVSSNQSCMYLLRKIFWTCVQINSYVTARHICGMQNVCADMLSRLSKDSNGVVFSRYHLCCS